MASRCSAARAISRITRPSAISRDARITTIYEGTSQLQVVAAVRGVCSGAWEKRIDELEMREYGDAVLANLKAKLAEGKSLVLKGIAIAKEKGAAYMDLYGRKLVDIAIAVLVGHLFLGQAEKNDRKKAVARRYIETNLADHPPRCGADLLRRHRPDGPVRPASPARSPRPASTANASSK